MDKAGIVHSAIGKISFDADKLAENAQALLGAVVKAKPAAAKGKYVKKVTLTSTMGPGILINETRSGIRHSSGGVSQPEISGDL